MKRIILILLIALLLPSISSCGGDKNRSYDEIEVRAAAEELIIKSAELNEIFWGEGIPYYEDDNYKNGQYYPADPVYLNKLGAETIKDIVEMTGEVFSKNYSKSIYGSILESSSGDYGMTGYTRYYQGVDVIMVYTKYKPLLTDEVEYICSRISVVGSKGDIVTVKVPIKVTRGELCQEREIEVDLIEEDGGWRIDSPTYASYRAE